MVTWFLILDLIHKLYIERIGVVEDEDLYDDVDKGQIQILKDKNILREIVIKEKKTKAPLIILFSKNHEVDEIDKLHLEKRTPPSLKEYWQTIDIDELEKKKNFKHSTFRYMDKNQEKKKDGKRRRNFKDYDNIYMWRNYHHLATRIEEGLKKLERKKGTNKKLKK